MSSWLIYITLHKIPRNSRRKKNCIHLVAKSSVVPQRPSRLRDWWWWRWYTCLVKLCWWKAHPVNNKMTARSEGRHVRHCSAFVVLADSATTAALTSLSTKTPTPLLPALLALRVARRRYSAHEPLVSSAAAESRELSKLAGPTEIRSDCDCLRKMNWIPDSPSVFLSP